MKHIKILLVGVLGIISLYTAPAMAQQSSAQVYATCGTAPYVAGQIRLDTQNTDGYGCVTGTLSLTPSPTGANVSVTPTIQNSSYVSGNCMGGFKAVSLGTAQSVLSQIMLSSQGGLITGKVLYVFSANPTGSTCTDKGTFTLAAADVSKLMVSPISINPFVSTGATASMGAASNLGLGIPSGGVVYVGIVETATETPATTTDLVLNFSAY